MLAMSARGRTVAAVVWAAVAVSFTACNHFQTKAAGPVASRIMQVPAAEQPQSPAVPGAPRLAGRLVEVSSPPQPTPTPISVQTPAPKSGDRPKLVASDRNQTFTVAQQAFRLLTHLQTVEGTNDETVEWWELRDAKDRVIHRESYDLAFENGMF